MTTTTEPTPTTTTVPEPQEDQTDQGRHLGRDHDPQPDHGNDHPTTTEGSCP